MTTRKTYICGTLRSNRNGNPTSCFKKTDKGRVAKTQISGCVQVKRQTRDLTISNMPKVQTVKVRNRNGKVTMKPNIIKDYNDGMSGMTGRIQC